MWCCSLSTYTDGVGDDAPGYDQLSICHSLDPARVPSILANWARLPDNGRTSPSGRMQTNLQR